MAIAQAQQLIGRERSLSGSTSELTYFPQQEVQGSPIPNHSFRHLVATTDYTLQGLLKRLKYVAQNTTSQTILGMIAQSRVMM
jgi:hypothetical protein